MRHFLFVLLVGQSPVGAPGAFPGDPLDPLTSAEIAVAREALLSVKGTGPELRFGMIALREPPKEAVLLQRQGGPMGRTAEALLFDWASSTPLRAQVDLRRGKVIRWDTLPSREPPMRIMVRRRVEEVVSRDSRWAQALRRRGIPDPALISVLPSLGESAPIPWQGESRVISAFGYHQEAFPGAQFLGGLRVRVNLTRGAILEFSDTGAGVGVGAVDSTPAVPPVQTTQPPPKATPVSLRGNEIRWRNWRLRFGMHPRRGLELWDIGWIENDRPPRPVLYRASVTEAMAVYGDPGYSVWYPRDAGNEGLGNAQRNSAVPGGDAPEGALFADAVLADDFGRPIQVPRAVAIYERDGGLLWRHSRRAGRAHQLVLTSHSTIDNYDFAFNWIFGEDGSIDIEVNLTGLMLTYRVPANGPTHTASSHLVAPGVLAPSHQHFFAYRLDFDVDGAAPNTVLETETRPQRRGRQRNPEGLWFGMAERSLASEKEAVRQANPSSNRMWRIVNQGRKNRLGDPVGYALVPGVSAAPFAHVASVLRRQAGFVNAQLFVTPFRRDEQYAGGEFQNFGPLSDGVMRWTRQDRPLIDTDVVIWYTLGVTHIPRPEEFPVMPSARAGFRLIPSGFFGKNPANPEPWTGPVR